MQLTRVATVAAALVLAACGPDVIEAGGPGSDDRISDVEVGTATTEPEPVAAYNPGDCLTWDPGARGAFWLTAEYFPEMLDLDVSRFPTMDTLRRCLGPGRVTAVPIPHDCQDGFLGAYWRRPEAYLDPIVRGGISSFAQLGPERVQNGLMRLADDLGSGRWAARHGALRDQDSLDLGYRLVIAERA